mmetsp:Transcript_24366/g.33558  ORF Transcript_24366/g.33558 Transcript_24366/m.33558 type:complete len:600 (+) Transcript_24366:163-1962(+)
MKLLFLLLNAFIAMVSSNDIQNIHVVGVAPSLARSYSLEDGKFRCLDSSRVIDEKMVNDDYCDCADASDEPGTAACSNGHFYCLNRGYHPKTVFSSFVNDGVCDCCDGSDEYAGRISCPNTCHSEGASVRAALKEELQASQKGAKMRVQYAASASDIKQKWAQELQKATEDATTLRPIVDALKVKNAAAEKAASAAMARKRKKADDELKEAAQELQEEEADAGMHEAEEGAAGLEQAESELGADEIIPEEESEEERGQRIAAQWTTNTEAAGGGGDDPPPSDGLGSGSGEDLPEEEQKHADEEAEGEQEEEDEFAEEWIPPEKPVDWNDEEDGVWEPPDQERDSYEEHYDYGSYNHEESEGYGDAEWNADDNPAGVNDDMDLDVEETPYSDAGNELDTDEDAGEDSSKKSILGRITSTLKRSWNMVAAKWGGQPFTEEEAEVIRKQFEEERRKLESLESTLEGLQKKLGRDYGPDEAFLPLEDKCTEVKLRQYIYQVCPFHSASQMEGSSTVNLGDWNTFKDNYTTMSFTSGMKCWNGPERSLTVSLVCGIEEKLSNVEEPNRCEYTAELATPAACSEDHVEFVKNKAESMDVSHDELR